MCYPEHSKSLPDKRCCNIVLAVAKVKETSLQPLQSGMIQRGSYLRA